MYRFEREKGVALILTFIVFVGLSVIAFAFLTMITYETRSTGTGLRNMQAFYIAEAGRAKARWALTVGEETPGAWGEEDIALGEGTYTVTTTDNGDDTCTITSYGYIPDDTNPVAQRRVVEADITSGFGELTNLSLDATAFASSKNLESKNANDGDAGTIWKADKDDDDAWLKLDFGSSTTFDRVVVNGQKNINSVTIEYSNDGTDYDEVTNLVESPAWTFTFDSVLAQYLKFNIDSTKTPEVNELETYDTNEEISVTLGRGKFITSL